MEKEKKYKYLFYALLVVLILFWSKYNDLKRESADLRESVSDYEYALSEANDSIEEVNSVIEDAQGYAWSNYYEMGYALESLYTIDTISTP